MLFNQPLPGRDCGECSLCCKVFWVPEFEKSMGQWCRHVKADGGCNIYNTRENVCREFHCGYQLMENLGPEWWPHTCGFLLCFDKGAIAVRVDPDRPDSWKQEPYYSEIMDWVDWGKNGPVKMAVYVLRNGEFLYKSTEEDKPSSSEEEILSAGMSGERT